MEQVASAFRNIVIMQPLQTALIYAIAESNVSGGFNEQQMQAIAKFVKTFCNMGERPEPIKRYPSKTLTEPKPHNSKPTTERV